jgi:hypothetical protein
MLIKDLRFMAGVEPGYGLPTHEQMLPHLQEVCAKIDTGDIVVGGQLLNIGRVLHDRIEVHDRHYQRVAPYLLAYEPQVIAALGRICTRFFFDSTRGVSDERIEVWDPKAKVMRVHNFGGHAILIHEYAAACLELKRALNGSAYRPGPVEMRTIAVQHPDAFLESSEEGSVLQ